jgi:hypothetical protein
LHAERARFSRDDGEARVAEELALGERRLRDDDGERALLLVRKHGAPNELDAKLGKTDGTDAHDQLARRTT